MIPPKTRTVRPGWRGALAAAWLAACLLPLPAHALGPGCQVDPSRAGNYEKDAGVSLALGKLAPDILTLDKSNPPGMVVYDQPLPPVPWVCTAGLATQHPFLTPGGYMQVVLKELAKTGLKMVLLIDNYPPWEPTGNTTDDKLPLTSAIYAPKSATDPTLTAKGVLLGGMQLVVVTPPTRPISAYFGPMDDIVRMHPGYLAATNRIQIGSTNGTRVALIPRCIAKISTPGTVHLGRAYGVGHLPLPDPVNFVLSADFDESCDGGFRIVDLGPLTVPLKVRFQPEGNQELTPFDSAIVLKNSDGQPNGLALGIKAAGVFPITFNQWHDTPTSLTVSNRPLPLYYSAQLQKTGAPLVPGAFSQQVTIQVTFQ
ncbi:fimbrial protein [Achromobacter xylosoxidans]|uniref:fimbrial protein n=1 Tax=Alcaligenes xylosoxydans xylosoxydans TaxID=85698 RepID=UPI0006C5647E|nr:hypothetical protein [Achromobacter xylosoxidans]UXL04000.1 hypothetical protein N4T34_24610 [Achromobacter xylosoxidans]CUJ27251.1 Uncharacterised protein [Achromobacter xylosoxidans]